MTDQLNEKNSNIKLKELSSVAEKYYKLKRDYKTTKWRANSEPVNNFIY